MAVVSVRPCIWLAAVGLGACLAAPAPQPLPDGWLRVEGNHIVGADGAPFRGRGATLPDTRGCDSCTYEVAAPAEVERRLDELVDGWGANLVRLVLESYAEPDGRVNYQNVLADAGYLADVERIVAHAASKPGLYLLLSLWIDPTLTSDHWPTPATDAVWARLVESFADDPHVLFEVVEDPESDLEGAQDAALWQALDGSVAAIRAAERAAGAPPHVVVVPAMSSLTRLDYYLDHPIAAGGGEAIAYGVGVGGPAATFPDFLVPAETLPVVVTAFGPWGDMELGDCDALMAAAESADIPWLAWIFHMRCSPDLLVDHSGGGCGVGMTLEATEWGDHVRARLDQPW
jgi:endoglucanase